MKIMNKYCLSVISVLTLLVFSSCGDDSNDDGVSVNMVQTVLNEFEDTFVKGGAAALILKSNGEIISGAIGESEEGTPLSADLSFAVGSISKTFTCVLTLQLIEEGSLKLTSTINELLPEIVSEKIPGNITIQQLLIHNSGLDHPLPGSNGLFNFVINNPSTEITFEKFVEFMEPPHSEPGTKFLYSDANYKVLGMVVEKIKGAEFSEVLRNELFNSLELNDTFLGLLEVPTNEQAFAWVNTESIKDLDRTAVESMGRYTGDVWSSCGNLANWFHAIFQKEVISESSLSLITTFNKGADGLDYGAGMFRSAYGGKLVYWHSGFTIAYSSFVGYVPSTGDIVVIINNQWNNEELINMVNDLVKEL
ncbi:serine hydrolase domain-containing protein [Fulvivirga lutea]|uniref:Beta-lactamase family protein n=1 Tax=Fulvivirga lutea TaxID=2810512 RepID=A0A975A2F0_9BACT|nr:serine hydrolase domain-containing protein [Fulvivirga lutea]QSE98771.1 beta-lactamase family protein [Fulvivirga lutea]